MEVSTPIVHPIIQTPICKVIDKVTRLIEENIGVEAIYRKSGSSNKIDKFVKKMEKQKLDDLDKHKNEVHELCGALKKYLSSHKDSVIPPEMFDNYCKVVGKTVL